MALRRPIRSLVKGVGANASLPALVVTLLLLAAPVALATGKQVRLLIPILTGNELDQVRKLAPSASIVTINGDTFLEVGSFTDARVAHRLGRSIQKRLAIPFDLAYDPDHPQIALALGSDPSPAPVAQVDRPAAAAVVATAPRPKPLPKPAPSDPIWNPLSLSFQAAAADVPAGASVAAEPEPTTQPAAIVASVMPAPQPVVRQKDAAVPVEAVRSVAKPVTATADVAVVPEKEESSLKAAKPDPTTQPAAIVASVVPAPQPELRQRDTAVSVDGVRSVAKPVTATAVVALAPVKEEPYLKAAEAEPTVQPAAIAASVVPAPHSELRQRDTAVSVDAVRSVAKPVAAIAPAASLDSPTGLDAPQHQLAKRRHASIEPLRRDPGRTTRIRNETRQAKREQQNLRPATEALASRPPQSQPHPWLRPVQIAAVKVEVPISRSGIAVNPQLNYIYVKIQQPSDVARLNQISPVMELNPVGDTLVARVGVFTQTRTGRRLMEARMQQLRQHQVELIVANGGRIKEMLA